MQPSAEQLRVLADSLSDDALRARLASGSLTEEATAAFRAELTLRGAALPEPAAAEAAAAVAPAAAPRDWPATLRALARRGMAFPVNAWRGAEAPWIVLAGVGGIATGLRTAVYFVALEWLRRHTPQAPVWIYALLAAYVLAAAWLAVGLWRSAPRLGFEPGVPFVRGLGCVLLLYALVDAAPLARMVYQLTPDRIDTHSLMEDEAPAQP